MSLLRRAELRVGLCPSRLVVARRAPGFRGALSGEIIEPLTDPLAELKVLARNARLSVVLSNHYVRYAVLPWSVSLTSEDDWLGYARHAFTSTYGQVAADWEIRVAPAGRRSARLAAGIESRRLNEIRSIPGVESIQPYLMAAFNACHRRIPDNPAWFVLQEPGRITFALLSGGAWNAVRCRQAGARWRESLGDALEREALLSEAPDCDQALLYAEEEPPAAAGRYRLLDLTLASGDAESRKRAMVLN